MAKAAIQEILDQKLVEQTVCVTAYTGLPDEIEDEMLTSIKRHEWEMRYMPSSRNWPPNTLHMLTT